MLNSFVFVPRGVLVLLWMRFTTEPSLGSAVSLFFFLLDSWPPSSMSPPASYWSWNFRGTNTRPSSCHGGCDNVFRTGLVQIYTWTEALVPLSVFNTYIGIGLSLMFWFKKTNKKNNPLCGLVRWTQEGLDSLQSLLVTAKNTVIS